MDSTAARTKGCRICQGKLRVGQRCIFCGLKVTKKADMDPMELHRMECREAHIKYLQGVHARLIKFRMQTTGDPYTDAQVIEHVGDWRDQLLGRESDDVVRDEAD